MRGEEVRLAVCCGSTSEFLMLLENSSENNIDMDFAETHCLFSSHILSLLPPLSSCAFDDHAHLEVLLLHRMC